MSELRHIAVIDVGKTNAKLALVDLVELREVAVVTRPNTVLAGPPYPHFDLEGHWEFFLEQLGAFHQAHGIDGISITTHGAAGVLLDAGGNLATPMLDYEHDGPDQLAAEYEAIRPAFADTGSPRLPAGLNLGAQLYWLLRRDPQLLDRTARIVTYPQYWGYRLTGRFASDASSLGCHTDIWEPRTGRPSTLVEKLGIAGKLAPARHASEVLGQVTAAVAERTGLPESTPVLCGIHDSNASLLPHLLGRTGTFSVVSTGTWVIAMSIGGEQSELDPARDTLINVDAHGNPVPSARFMGGREYDLVRGAADAAPTDADRRRVLSEGIMLMPAIVSHSGPFPDRQHRWIGDPATDGERLYALALYLSLMTHTCLGLVGARGPVIVEGPFARNRDYMDMLSVLRGEGVEAARSATGTSIGAALLFGTTHGSKTRNHRICSDAQVLSRYARNWRAALGT